MEATVKLICEICGEQFHRRKTEYNRNIKRGLNRNFCSRQCCGKGNIGNIPKDSIKWDHLNPSNRKDEFSPFRWHYRNAKRRGHEFNLTLEYLKELWYKQDGKCPYTNWKLKNMKNLSTSSQLPITPDRASLDRIDSSKGYVKGNVQFVCYMAQCAKMQFSSEDVKLFAEAVINNEK
tara:strand:+ start:37669 stop:38199 length:531 start_codon:yes stop_codon:yes gene_type:complete